MLRLPEPTFIQIPILADYRLWVAKTDTLLFRNTNIGIQQKGAHVHLSSFHSLGGSVCFLFCGWWFLAENK